MIKRLIAFEGIFEFFSILPGKRIRFSARSFILGHRNKYPTARVGLNMAVRLGFLKNRTQAVFDILCGLTALAVLQNFDNKIGNILRGD